MNKCIMTVGNRVFMDSENDHMIEKPDNINSSDWEDV